MKKILILIVVFLFIGLCLPPAYAIDINQQSDINEENNLSHISPHFYWTWLCGVDNPSFYFYLGNSGNETYRGNVSCRLTINSSIMIFCNNVNISDYYVEIEPGENILIFKTLYLGFGIVKGTFELIEPCKFKYEYYGFLLLTYLFLWTKN